MTPFFIIFLFYDHPYAKLWSLIIFVVASITDSIDGYYARKYNQITKEGQFLDPLADKILVSSAFISFAIIGVIDYWMVSLILFRDFFITGLRVAMSQKGLELVTSNVAKAKTTTQLVIIIFTLIILSLNGVSINWLYSVLEIVQKYNLVYSLTFLVTLFTIYTGVNYLYTNKSAIYSFIKLNGSRN